jgi:hypothetical protein
MVDHHLGLVKGARYCGPGDQADTQEAGPHSVQLDVVVAVVVSMVVRRLLRPRTMTMATTCPGRQGQGENQEKRQTGR